MKIARVETGHIALVWLLIFVLLGSMLWFGYRRNTASLNQLMRSETHTLMDVITVSSAASIHALDELEYLSEERLLDNAFHIATMYGHSTPSAKDVVLLASRFSLHRIVFLDRRGRIAADSDTTVIPVELLSAAAPVIDGREIMKTAGFTGSRYFGGQPYGVVAARPAGGAVIVAADPERMLWYRRTIGLGTVFRDFGSREGIRYVVLQDSLGIIAASPGVREMTSIAVDPFLARARKEGDSRTIRFNGETVVEAVRPFIVDDVNLGILRVGHSTATVNAIKSRAFLQFMFLFVAAVISGALLVVYAVLRQKYMLLTAEHDRILAEVRLMEEDRRRSERLASMGRLAAGVAHEIRNPLNAVSIIIQRLKAEFVPSGQPDEYASLLTTVRSEIARIGGIIESFLRYARPPRLEIVEVRLSGLAVDAVAVIEEKARVHGVAVSIDIPDGLVCRCDPTQMKQALLNLILNAVEAAGTGGAVTIAARPAGGDVILDVRDTGPGIPDDIMPGIFDPYFTTKEHGTGLGLSEVHRIITSHGGRISASNAPSGGAVLSIRLPEKSA